MLLSFVSNVALADCDWSKGISPNKDGSYTYSKECHLRVGQLVEDNKTKDLQIADLNKAIQLKDLALQKSDERVNLWMDTSIKLENSLTKVDELQSKNNALYFGLGVASTILSVFVASKVIGR
jgi:hypothetical protein